MVGQAHAPDIVAPGGPQVHDLAGLAGALDPEAVAKADVGVVGVKDRRDRRLVREPVADVPELSDALAQFLSDVVLVGHGIDFRYTAG